MMNAFADLLGRLTRVTSGGAYVPQIDGLRFLALIPMLFYHAGLRGARISPDPAGNEVFMWLTLPSGNAVVSLFFFISGYIIAYPFLSNRPPRLKDFYRRRLFRIEPPYIIVMLGCFFLLSQYTPSRAPNFDYTDAPLWQSLLASLTYSHGLVFGEHPKLNPPAWSLEREVQFYLLAPFIMFAYLKIKNRHARLWVGGLICLVLLIVGEVIRHQVAEHTSLRNTLLAESYSFALGVLVCDYSVAAKPFEQIPRRRYDVCLIVGYIGLLVTGCFEPRIILIGQSDPSGGIALGVPNIIARAICIVLIFLGAARGVMGRAALSVPIVTVIGGACYSIYLVHLPLMHALAEVINHVVHPSSLAVAAVLCWVILIPCSVAFGLVFYAFVERPCMRPNWPSELAAVVRGWFSASPRAVAESARQVVHETDQLR